jgi:L-fucose isomerase-like protein
MLSQSRVLRVGDYATVMRAPYGALKAEVISLPAEEYNRLFDSIQPDEATRAAAMQFKQDAMEVIDVTDEYFVEAFRAHRAVCTLLDRYDADGITIDCLMLQHRKPCVSFSLHNGNLTASCGCENDIRATMTMLLNRYLFGRPGFQHNSEYDEVRNQYFATHCTCATRLYGPGAPAQQYKVRPFFHQLPKTPALDVQWTPQTPVILSKMYSERDIRYYTGKVIGSPACPPTGGCATRVLVDFGIDPVTSVYLESHPILSVGTADDARCYKIFSKMVEAKRGPTNAG